MPKAPLAEGLLTGKYIDGTPGGSRAEHEKSGVFLRNRLGEANIEKTRRLGQLAADLGIPLSTLSLRWILRRKEISSCIIGASRPEQILENAKAPLFEWDSEIDEHIEAILSA